MKLGDLHNVMLEHNVPDVQSYKFNNVDWRTGFRVGVQATKQELSTVALRYEGYTKELERMLTAVGVHENILAQIQKECGL